MALPTDQRTLESIAARFRGLAHPTRLQILAHLRAEGPLSPAQLVRRVESKIALGSIAHHTRELHALGLISPAGTEPVRGALQHFYRLSPKGQELLELVDRVAQ